MFSTKVLNACTTCDDMRMVLLLFLLGLISAQLKNCYNTVLPECPFPIVT